MKALNITFTSGKAGKARCIVLRMKFICHFAKNVLRLQGDLSIASKNFYSQSEISSLDCVDDHPSEAQQHDGNTKNSHFIKLQRPRICQKIIFWTTILRFKMIKILLV